MPTYSEFATQQMLATGVTFCDEGIQLIGTHTVQDAYDQPNEKFWMWALHQTNKPVAQQLVTTMMQNLIAAGAQTPVDPITNPNGFRGWAQGVLASRKTRSSAALALAQGCRLVQDDTNGLSPLDSAFLQMQFVSAYIAAMSDLTGQPESDVKAALKPWFLTQVTLDQFSAGGTYT